MFVKDNVGDTFSIPDDAAVYGLGYHDGVYYKDMFGQWHHVTTKGSREVPEIVMNRGKPMGCDDSTMRRVGSTSEMLKDFTYLLAAIAAVCVLAAKFI